MNIERMEKVEGKVCSRCGMWKPLEEYNKQKLGKYGRRADCKKCQKEQSKQWRENNKEYRKEYGKQWRENNPEYNKQWYKNNLEYSKQWRENNKEHKKEYDKQRYQIDKERYRQYYQNNKERYRQYYQNNKEHTKECNKQWRENRKEYDKQRYQSNKERYKERDRQYRENNKQNNLQYISSIVEQINPIFKQLNLPIYGYVYMFENVKTSKVYIGQTINPLSRRYRSDIIQGWIKDRLKYNSQKFKEELIEKDFVVTEILDVGCCQYHLDKLEAYYIGKYDSYNNGYNNNAGHHDTDDGIEEFNQILSDHSMEFKDGKLIQIKAPTQE